MTDHGLPTALVSQQSLPAIGLGTARLGAFWQGRSIREGRDAVETALQLGITVIDTADVYARGLAERIIGSVLSSSSAGHNAVIITKAGLVKTPAAMRRAHRAERSGAESRHHGIAAFEGLKPAGRATTCFHPDYLEWAVNASLKRLKRDRVEVFLLHEPDSATLRSEATVTALERMRQDGRIGCWGASVRTLEEAAAAMDLPGLSWLQVPLSVISAPDFTTVSRHRRRAEVTVQAMALTGHGLETQHPESSGAAVIETSPLEDKNLREQILAERPAEKIAQLVRQTLIGTDADLVLVGMSSGHRVYQNVAAIQRGGR